MLVQLALQQRYKMSKNYGHIQYKPYVSSLRRRFNIRGSSQNGEIFDPSLPLHDYVVYECSLDRVLVVRSAIQ